MPSPADFLKTLIPTATPLARQKNNGHVHLPPNFSAFENVEQLIDMAKKEGIRALGVTNYYDFTVYGPFTEQARAAGIFPLFGLEIICLVDELVKACVRINDPGNPGKYYVCGKGITQFWDQTPRAKELYGAIRSADDKRMAEMSDKLSAVLTASGIPIKLTAQDVVARVVARHGCPTETVTLQERHVAMVFQQAIFEAVPEVDRAAALEKTFGVASKNPASATGVQNEIRSHLMKAGKPGFVAETFINFETAYEVILELGGIPCYPTLADGANPLCGYEETPEHLVSELQKRNIFMAEFIPLRNKPEVLTQYVTTLRAAGIPVCGGTEHNSLDLIPIEPFCIGGAPVPEAVQDIFWEGACVVAAHQYLTAKGECGFVDKAGKPNSAYPDAEARIRAFAELGARIMAA
ncbi:TPA: hypothetical protein DDW35_13695 [Candidatus Sumerlaeota bacterium]|nr:hypothetical protein [Candidatus Sumerlaeota bacterium]